MKELNFTKMVGAGNDFVVLDFRLSSLIPRPSLSKLAVLICQRKIGIGADGMLVLEKSKKADFKMRIFNADGSEAEMCGNGLRCAALSAHKNKKRLIIETIAGIYEAVVTGKNQVKIKMESPKDIKQEISLLVNGRAIKVNYIDTGVPHTVIFVQGLDNIDVDAIGRSIRYHKEFKPRGTNVDFVEFIDDNNIKMRTYERGVEGETLACGTGAVAAAIISAFKVQGSRFKGNVLTRGGILKVYFSKIDDKIKDVYLEGEAREVFVGSIKVYGL